LDLFAHDPALHLFATVWEAVGPQVCGGANVPFIYVTRRLDTNTRHAFVCHPCPSLACNPVSQCRPGHGVVYPPLTPPLALFPSPQPAAEALQHHRHQYLPPSPNAVSPSASGMPFLPTPSPLPSLACIPFFHSPKPLPSNHRRRTTTHPCPPSPASRPSPPPQAPKPASSPSPPALPAASSFLPLPLRFYSLAAAAVAC